MRSTRAPATRASTAPSFKMNFSPRFNLVYDVNGDGKMAVKFSANRYNQPLSLLLLDRLNPQIVSTAIPGTTANAISDTRQWLSQAQCNNPGVLGCDRNGDLIPQISELGPSPGYTYPTVLARYEDGLERPAGHRVHDRIPARHRTRGVFNRLCRDGEPGATSGS